jgi:hypothetical protein
MGGPRSAATARSAGAADATEAFGILESAEPVDEPLGLLDLLVHVGEPVVEVVDVQ